MSATKAKVKFSALPVSKLDLQDVLEHQLAILREFDGNIVQEQQALGASNELVLQAVIEERIGLVTEFQSWQQSLFQIANQLFGSLEKGNNFADTIKALRARLDAEDCELLLLCDQMVGILQQIESQTSLLVDFIENKAPQPLTLPHSEVSSPKKVAVCVLIPGQEHSDSDL